MKIKAALTRRQDGYYFDFEEVEMREPKQGEVRVKLVSSGVCSTDVAYCFNLYWPVPLPMVLGHEGAGIVESVGPGVTKFKVGDHVVISNPSCGECEGCKNNQEWLCDKYTDLSLLTSGLDYFGGTYMNTLEGGPVYTLFSQGSFAEYVMTNERAITKINDDIDLKIAGPLGCGLRTGSGAVKGTLKPQPGQWLLVNGAGPVGLSALWMGHAMGAKTIVVDMDDKRCEMARNTGADVVLNPRGMTAEEEIQKIKELTNGGPNCVAECIGIEAPLKIALNAMKPGGTMALVACAGETHFNQFWAELDGKTVTAIRMGSINNDDIIPDIADLYTKGLFPFDQLNSYYKFEDIEQAFKDYEEKKVIKPVLLFD